MSDSNSICSANMKGCVSIPEKLFSKSRFKVNDMIKMYQEDNKIVIGTNDLSCIFCGNSDEGKILKGKLVCHTCIDGMR